MQNLIKLKGANRNDLSVADCTFIFICRRGRKVFFEYRDRIFSIAYRMRFYPLMESAAIFCVKAVGKFTILCYNSDLRTYKVQRDTEILRRPSIWMK